MFQYNSLKIVFTLWYFDFKTDKTFTKKKYPLKTIVATSTPFLIICSVPFTIPVKVDQFTTTTKD